jgi:hypothetical protein
MLTQHELKNILEYNPETGSFIWIKHIKGTKGLHSEAGTLSYNGYRDVCIKGKKYGLHRLAFLYMTGHIPDNVDHINCIKHDNRWCNLRPATVRENSFNYKGTGSKSNYKNVYYDPRSRKKWFVRITDSEGNKISLGYFQTPEEANDVAKAARLKHHGQFNWEAK